jgi:hypothetical protein
MRVKFLFWNIDGGQGTLLLPTLTRLADSGIDVFMFAEAPSDLTPVTTALNATTSDLYELVTTQSTRVRFFTRLQGVLGGATWRDRYFDALFDRLTALELQPVGVSGIIVIGTHLDSPASGLSEGDRAEWARDVSRDVRIIEGGVGHDRTVLVGDMNMNPYSDGLVQTTALHAVMSRNLTEVVVRHQARDGYPVFYNPMWSCLGDRPRPRLRPEGERRPPGTHYFDNTSGRANTFWQMYDQVLLRPALMDQLTNLEILDGDGIETFASVEGKPRRVFFSDHLPVLFELNL